MKGLKRIHVKNLCAVLFSLQLSLQMFSQVPSIMLLSSDSSYKQRDAFVFLNGAGLIGSNALDNSFFKKSILGGHLESAHLNALNNQMKDQNRAGFLASGGFDLMNFRDTLFHHPEWGLRVSMNTNYHAAASFNRDLFDLIYRGNSSFAGGTATPGPLSFQYQAWQKFGVGFFNKNNLSGITVSLVEGQAFQSLIVSDANFYTSPSGDSLSLSYRGDYMRSDSTKKGMANGSGLGAAIDFDFNLPLNDHKGVISISVRDFGFVAWNKNSQTMTFDSLNSFTGLNLNNLFAFSTDTVGFPNLRDSLHYAQRTKRFVAPLPASIVLRYCRKINERDFYEIGLSMWPNRAAIPLVYVGMNHFVGDHFIFSEKISYGGYAKFGIGAEMQWMPKGSWMLRLGTNNLGGWTMSSAKGRDMYLTLGKSF